MCFLFRCSCIFEIHCCIVDVFCKINCYCKCVYRIRCLFLYIWRYFKDMFYTSLKKWPRSVNNSRTKYLFVNFWNFGVLNGPLHTHTHTHTHPQRQSQSSLPGEKCRSKCFLVFFAIFLKMKKMGCITFYVFLIPSRPQFGRRSLHPPNRQAPMNAARMLHDECYTTL